MTKNDNKNGSKRPIIEKRGGGPTVGTSVNPTSITKPAVPPKQPK